MIYQMMASNVIHRGCLAGDLEGLATATGAKNNTGGVFA